MLTQPDTLSRRTVGEWVVVDPAQAYKNPFTDVKVDGAFTAPSGRQFHMPGFYDGDGTWRVRFNPDEAGRWTFQIASFPANAALQTTGTFEVMPSAAHGFLCATPGKAWGFHDEAGNPVFLLGDTTYNLFGAAHCDLDIHGFLKRRAAQGFNFLRVRLQVSPFHPANGYSRWQMRRTWPWGGSEQSPQLDRFNLDWFRTVDRAVAFAEEIGMGLEMIMQAWGFEFPFNNRTVFTAEWEELWNRYLVARYDAYNCVWFWTLMNEYEYYPDGVLVNKPAANHWAIRIARWMKANAPHGHVITVHNGPSRPPMAERLVADPDAVDCVMFQEWGAIDRDNAWLATGIDDVAHSFLKGWRGSAVLVEYSYERNPAIPLTFSAFEFCDEHHTRRGAWRGACSGLCIANGFENTWGPELILDEDQPGVPQLALLREFFTSQVAFAELQPDPDLIGSQSAQRGHDPLAMATPQCDSFVIYLPAGGQVAVRLPVEQANSARWFDPRTGQISAADAMTKEADTCLFSAPEGHDEMGRPLDWVLFRGSDRATA